ncbi:uncharacterized protein LOC113557647 [Rhopalosiphum maidis]|uniref:uncharacterized protein LOC113557647 n=1 Tax=Rhopalosiphum maidis TaxID=43146 RepID=UPI000EFE4D8A|nr:uncharacterized protein LOC113557647 [Rhopalosiphum maidis]
MMNRLLRCNDDLASFIRDERINYCELYDDHVFINRFRISKATFSIILRLIEEEISPPSQRYFGVLKRKFPVLSKGITVNLSNTQAIIVMCAVMQNICIDMHDEVPNDLCEDNNDENIREGNFFDLPENTRGRQERDQGIRDHFVNLL